MESDGIGWNRMNLTNNPTHPCTVPGYKVL